MGSMSDYMTYGWNWPREAKREELTKCSYSAAFWPDLLESSTSISFFLFFLLFSLFPFILFFFCGKNKWFFFSFSQNHFYKWFLISFSWNFWDWFLSFLLIHCYFSIYLPIYLLCIYVSIYLPIHLPVIYLLWTELCPSAPKFTCWSPNPQFNYIWI